ncbi:MAG: phosphoribosylglycinamide formyltransferase, partial [Bacteroidetes bacterium]
MSLRIAIFASGAGTNAQKIIEYFEGKDSVQVALIVSNKPDAPVLNIARAHQIPTYVLNRREFYQTEDILN